MRPQRVNVIGVSGSGKTTLAKQIASRLNAPYIEMDALFWGPDWTEKPDEVFLQKLDTAVSEDRWVLDGNYSRTTHTKWKRVHMVVWIDYSFPRTFFQSLRRAISRIRSNEELWPGTGNRETFRKTFLSQDSILLWMLTSYSKVRRRYLQVISNPDYSHIEFVHLRTPKQSQDFLERLSP